jgi:RHS repeat-associated protein
MAATASFACTSGTLAGASCLDALTRTRYEPYGNTAAGSVPTGIGFTGHVNDADTGLVYMQQRYYDPIAGRFKSVDPITADANTGESFNRYEYAQSNPYRYTDPDGRDSWSKEPQQRVTKSEVTGSHLLQTTVVTTTSGGPTTVSTSGPAGTNVTAIQIGMGGSGLSFDFGKFTDQIERNRSDTAADLGVLGSAGAVGTMPKTPGELRGLGAPTSELNPYTSQLSRWSGRLGVRELRTFGRTGTGIALSTAATAGLIFDGFYNWGVIGKAAWDATSWRWRQCSILGEKPQ